MLVTVHEFRVRIATCKPSPTRLDVEANLTLAANALEDGAIIEHVASRVHRMENADGAKRDIIAAMALVMEDEQ